eukprot:768507-Hanusia_phi.AAC.3
MQPVDQKYKKKLPVCFGPITDKNVEQVKTLNRSIFPVKYNDKFYNDVQNSGNYTQLGQTRLLFVVRDIVPTSILFDRYSSWSDLLQS